MNENTVLLGADSAQMQGGGRSLFDKASDAVTYGAGAAALSGIASIYNTAAYASNSVFGTTLEDIDTAKTLGSLDNNWRQYYEDNKQPIDTVGFLGGSFIPGMIAVKAVNAVRLGEGVGVLKNVLGYTAGKQKAYLEAGLQQIGTAGGDVFATLNQNKLLAMTYGAADQVLQTAVFETAAAVSMKRGPTLNDENWGDIAWDITKTSLAGGLLGGGIEALWTNKIFRDAGKAVEGRGRQYDTLVALDKINLDIGDKAFGTLDAVLSLPKEVLAGDKTLKYNYSLQGRNYTATLDTSKLFEGKIGATWDRGIQKFQQTLTDAVKTDPSVGAPFSRSMVELVLEGRNLGKTDEVIRQEVGNFLFNLHSMESLGSSSTDFTKDIVYLTPGASITGAREAGAAELFSPVRASSADNGYRIVGDHKAGKYGVLGVDGVGTTQKDAFERGYDIVFSGEAGKVHVNPDSKIFRPIADNNDSFLRTTFNTRTKQVSETPVATIADVADNAGVRVNSTGVSAGKFTLPQTVDNFNFSLDSIRNTARHLWASTVNDLRNVTIDARDFSLLDRAVANPDIIDATTKVRLNSGEIVKMDDLPALKEWVFGQKSAQAADLLEASKGQLDTRQLAYYLNTDQKWVEDAVGKQFNPAQMDKGEAAFRDLASYSQRDNVVLIYNKPPIAAPGASDFPTGYLGYRSRVELAKNFSDNMAGAVLGESGARFLDIDPKALQGKFDATGAGPSGAGFSDAGYFDPGRRWAQDTGRATHLTQQEFRNNALEPLQSHFAGIIKDGNKEFGAVLQFVRQSDTRLSLWNGWLVDLPSLEKYQKLKQMVASGKARQDSLDKFEFKINKELQKQTYDALSQYHDGHVDWLNNYRMLASAQGRTVSWNDQALYLPPINTRSVPFFAFVRGVEGKIGGTSETTMITAKSAEELRRLTRQVETNYPDLKVIYKDDVELFKKAQGDYDYSRALNTPQIDPMLRKAGLLGDFIPTLEPKAVVEEFVQHIARREDELVRSAVQVKYGQTFAELKWLSDQTTKAEKSKFQFLGRSDVQKITDPFGDYTRLALNISKQAEYTLWSQANEFVDALGKKAYGIIEESWRQSKAGDMDWLDANAQLEKLGLKGVFTDQANYLANQTGADRSLTKIAIAKANMLLANVTLRLDTANAIVNTISSPITMGMEISALRNSIKKDPQLLEQFNGLLQEGVPGTNLKIPSSMRLISNAVKNYFADNSRQLIDRYQNVVGSIRGEASQLHDMLGDLALTPDLKAGAWAKKVDEWTEKGAKWTGNNFAEQFTRFIASNVMHQITEPLVAVGKMTEKEQNSFIAIFTNRVQGNYITSQRPIMFQGVIGGAIGLFQTYQFNMMQNIFRHIENKDGKALAVGAALQSSIFGLQGLPLFDAINTHLIGNANINQGHRDVYSEVAAADKEWGDFAMYGAASALPFMPDQAPALYTRGDLNPRHLTIIPTSFGNLPAVEGLTRVASAVWGMGNQLANGGDFGKVLLHGMEHNGISRPLAGLAQVMQGASTTSKGSIIAANGDLLSISTAARLIGSKPMDEAVAMNTKYRLTAYQAADKARINDLAIPMKQKLREGNLTEDDVTDFAGRYAAAGGRVQSYGAFLQAVTKSARESDVNTIMRAHKTPAGQRLMEVMGADPLNDFTNMPPEN